MSEEKILMIKKNMDNIFCLRKNIEKLRKEQDQNTIVIEENNIIIRDIREKIENNNKKIKEALNLKREHEKNINFKSKHRILNKVSGFLHIFGFPTYSIENSKNEIKRQTEIIISIEKENEKYYKKMVDLEDKNMLLWENNNELAESICKLNEEIDKKSKENYLLEINNLINYNYEQEKIEENKEHIRKKELSLKGKEKIKEAA